MSSTAFKAKSNHGQNNNNQSNNHQSISHQSNSRRPNNYQSNSNQSNSNQSNSNQSNSNQSNSHQSISHQSNCQRSKDDQSNNRQYKGDQSSNVKSTAMTAAGDGLTEELLAIESIQMSCPQCKHQFKLIDGLIVEDLLAQPQLPDEPQELPEQQWQLHSEQPSKSSSAQSPASRSDSCSIEKTTGLTMETATHQTAGAQTADPSYDAKPAQAQVCQTFQIVNWTIHQLERLICDPYDRRIRKISSISQCDIEIRSELPSRKFGAAKNYCVMRAYSPSRIEKCRSLLRLQMDWVLLPKP